IGDQTARGIMASMAERGWDADALTLWTPPPRARDAHRSLTQLLRRLRGTAKADSPAPEHNVATEIDVIRQMYDSLLRDKYDRPEPRLADLDQLRAIASGFPNRSTFLSTIALEPP